MIYPKHQQLDHKRAKRRINLIMAYLYLPVSDVGSIYSKRFKYGRFKNALSNLNYELQRRTQN